MPFVNFFFLFISLISIRSISAFDANSNKNIAVYWGQNSQGNQQTLGEYCQSSDANIFILSFMNNFSKDSFSLDFANACSDTFSDTGLLHCSQIAQDIKTCQSLDKKVLLSLGGASGTYGFSSDSDAESFAQTLWNTFGEGNKGSEDVEHPFDSSLIDGFDFDIENSNSVGYAALVTKLRELFTESSKQYYISAAPQCVYPDASVGDMLSNADIDFAFVQFYNNYCNVDKQFNWDSWTKFAQETSPNSNIRLFLTLPGASGAAGSGYISDLELLKSTVETISQSNNFGGIALWDASQAVANEINGQNYVENVKSILDGISSSSSSTTSISSSSSSSSTTSTTSTGEKITSTLIPVSYSTTTEVTSSINGEERITSTIAPVTTALPPSSITSTSTVSTSTTPLTSSSIERTTTTLSPATSTSTSTTVATSTDRALESAKTLNRFYSEGKFNGNETCEAGQIACSKEGQISLCDNGEWVSMQCGEGTTCFAFVQNEAVFTQCNNVELKANFL